MRFGHALLASVLATGACSDGVGTPIREALASDDGSDGGAGRRARDLPRTCAEVADWDEAVEESERQLVLMLNDARERGLCSDRQFTQPPLVTAAELRCSARLHSVDMAINDRFQREGSDLSLPGDRMEDAGFQHGDASESIVAEEFSAEEAYEDLFLRSNSNGCRDLSDRDFTHIGVGLYEGYWTIDYAQAQSSPGTGGP